MCNCKNNKKINSEAFFHSHYFLMNIINSLMKCNTEGLFVLSQAGPVLSQTNRILRVFISFETNKTMSSVSIHYTLRLSLIISRTIKDKPWHWFPSSFSTWYINRLLHSRPIRLSNLLRTELYRLQPDTLTSGEGFKFLALLLKVLQLYKVL